MRNRKSLKRNDGACKGVFIRPSKLLRFSTRVEIPIAWDFCHAPRSKVGFGSKISVRMALLKNCNRKQVYRRSRSTEGLTKFLERY